MAGFVMEDGADAIAVQLWDRFGRNLRESLQRFWQFQEKTAGPPSRSKNQHRSDIVY